MFKAVTLGRRPDNPPLFEREFFQNLSPLTGLVGKNLRIRAPVSIVFDQCDSFAKTSIIPTRSQK